MLKGANLSGYMKASGVITATPEDTNVQGRDDRE
jgi:hypothetical protein